MKYIKTYENLLKGKSKERLLNELKGDQLIEFLIQNNMFDKLPRNEYGICVYKANYLNLKDFGLTSLPDNLTANGWVNCSGNELTSLPENLIVTGDFYCNYNELTSLPKNLKVGGGLSCFYNQLTSLPENLKVYGDFNCQDNRLTYLPNNMYIDGDLDCGYQKSGIKLELPKTAIVKGKFYN